jgi:NADH:ubiquinone oxidoreductase subunit C
MRNNLSLFPNVKVGGSRDNNHVKSLDSIFTIGEYYE